MTQLQVTVQEAVGTGLTATARVAPGIAGRLAFELWRRPGRRARVAADERAVHEAAWTTAVDHPRGPVTAYRWGDGERPVLLVHGWASRASRYAALVTALLDAGLSPASYDAWGHGATPGRAGTVLDHAGVIEELDRRCGGFESLVGHSFGVPVVLYAAREGIAARRLVTISGMADIGYLVDTFCARLGVPAGVNRELRHAIERGYFAGDPDIWDRFTVRAAADRDLLVVHDTGDRIVDRAQADLLQAAYGGRARLLETHGLGHARILRDPDVVAATVGFLA